MTRGPFPEWSDEKLDQDRLQARTLYRERRLAEPAEVYGDAVEEALQATAEVLELTSDLERLREELPTILANPAYARVLRYLTGPPLSEDDLRVMSQTSLSTRYLQSHEEGYGAIFDVVATLLDRVRFPWAAEQRKPASGEVDAARVATALIIGAQQVHTTRRGESSALVASVSDAFARAGYARAPKRHVDGEEDWPRLGEVATGKTVLGRPAGLVATTFQGHHLTVDSKVSGSELNSVKRLTRDAGEHAELWLDHFSAAGFTPVVVLEGVYPLDRLLSAQAAGMAIIWSHELGVLENSIKHDDPAAS